MENDKLILGGHEFNSRFILGSGKYSLDLIKAAVENAGAEIITLALRRAVTGNVANILDYIPKNVTLLPNTSGARNADEAVRIARLARERLPPARRLHPGQHRCGRLCLAGTAPFGHPGAGAARQGAQAGSRSFGRLLCFAIDLPATGSSAVPRQARARHHRDAVAHGARDLHPEDTFAMAPGIPAVSTFVAGRNGGLAKNAMGAARAG